MEKMEIQSSLKKIDLNTWVVHELPSKSPGNFTEKLAEIPGVDVNQRGAFSSEPMIRGLGFDRVSTSLNGLRLPNGSPTRTHAPMGQFGGTLYRSFQVVHYLPSLTLGPPVTGGWIDQKSQWTAPGSNVSKQPSQTSFGVDWFPDRNGRQWNAFNSGSLGPIGYRASLFRNQIGNYTSADNREVPSRHEDWGGSFSLAGNTGERLVHSIDTVFRKQFFTENVSLPLDVEDGNFWAITATHEFRRSEKSDDGNLQLRYGYTEADSTLSNERRDTRPILVSTETETQAFHADLRWKTIMPIMGDIEVGLDTNHEERLAIRQRGPVAKDFIWPDIQYEQAGIFAESLSQPINDTTLRIGLRWDRVRSEARMADQLAFGRSIESLYREYNGPSANKSSQQENALSANALLRWNPQKTITYYAGIGSSAQTPPPTERYRAFLNALGGGFELGNPSLKPERKWEVALGTEILSENLALRIDTYYFGVENYIWRQFVGTTAGILPVNPPQSVFSYRNVDTAFIGLELQGTWKVTPHFKVPFSVEWVDAQLRQSGTGFLKGDSLPELPPAEFRVSGIWDWKMKSVEANLEWAMRWVGSQSNELPAINPIYDQSDSYFLHDLYLTLKKSDLIVVKLGIRNLFDKLYSPYLTPPTSSIRPSSGDLNPGDKVPGAGQEFVASFTFKF